MANYLERLEQIRDNRLDILNILASTQANARKSFGSYKPVLQRKLNSYKKHTEVLGQGGNRTRGLTFPTKEEATEYAQSILNERIERAQREVETAQSNYDTQLANQS